MNLEHNYHDQGGAIYALEGTANIYWSEFTYNNAGNDSGAVHVPDATVNIYQCEFVMNI